MIFTYEIVIGLCIVSAVTGFFCGCLPESVKYLKLKNKPLTYYELINLPNGTEVLLLQYAWKEKGNMHKEHGEIYTREDGRKAINVYEGDIEFTQADVWLVKRKI